METYVTSKGSSLATVDDDGFEDRIEPTLSMRHNDPRPPKDFANLGHGPDGIELNINFRLDDYNHWKLCMKAWKKLSPNYLAAIAFYVR